MAVEQEGVSLCSRETTFTVLRTFTYYIRQAHIVAGSTNESVMAADTAIPGTQRIPQHGEIPCLLSGLSTTAKTDTFLSLSAIAAPTTDRQPSPPTAIDPARLSSNNPFRNRLSVQPTSPSMQPSTIQQSAYPANAGASKNPFLDPASEPRKTSPPRDLNPSKSKEVDEAFVSVLLVL